MSVFAPRAGAFWWDLDDPLAYASGPAQSFTPEASGGGVRLGESQRWLTAVDRGELAGTARDAVADRGDHFPEEEGACWIAVQIHDPGATPTTTYTVHADSGSTAPVPAEQYEERTVDGHPSYESTGEPGQSCTLLSPRTSGPLPRILVDGEAWTTVTSFAGSGEGDEHVVINASTGRVHFGPEVTGGPSGTRRYGAVPDRGAAVTVAGPYRVTLGAAGNGVPEGGIDRLVSGDDRIGVRNTTPTHDGKDGYTDTSGGSTQAGVRLMVIPSVTADARGWFPFHMLTPGRDAGDTLRRALRTGQPEGVPVWLEQPGYHGIRIDARIVPADYRTATERAELGAAAEQALYRYFSPVGGGPDGTGWPLGRPVHVGEAFRVLEQVPGVARVATAHLTPVDPRTGAETAPVARLDCGPAETVYSVEHRVTVAEVPS